jgi:predicted nucleic acid-binding protein
MTSQSKKVYLASDIFLAFLDRANEKHRETAAFFRYFALEKYNLFTDSITLYDAYVKISQRLSVAVAKDFLRTIMLSNITIFYPDESDMKAINKIYLNDRTSDLTLGQAVMAVMADRKGIQQIATFSFMHTLFGLTAFYMPL